MSKTYHHHHRQMQWRGPRWWRRETTDVPCRRETRDLLRKVVVQLMDIEDAPEFPEGKKSYNEYYY